ncbi:hypothetical protein ACYOEI_38100 [Singulisphaera rosea]
MLIYYLASQFSVAPIPSGADPDFVEGLNSFCLVEFDANAEGASKGERGDRLEDWTPLADPYAYRCRLVQARNPRSLQLADKPSETLRWRVLFGQFVSVDIRNRLVIIDPDDGTYRYLYILGKIVNAHQMGHHWYCDAIEYTN